MMQWERGHLDHWTTLQELDWGEDHCLESCKGVGARLLQPQSLERE